ncbi:MAG TPA: acyl-CoA dehydratase activase [Syntrophales bacterium]|nr:acyl-CoA dehydratase activase [Syntrophales bacterium]HOL58508.1 acyl-CoA dehydratase activase [Syntrophales bacterium]HPO34884.1 acyl-CoA dehydratase activase [Syntrophales bacterium]
MYTLGIDVGSITTKAALLQGSFILGTKVIFTGYNVEKAAKKVVQELLGKLHIELSEIGEIWATGYGRKSVSIAGRQVTEIMCHAAGAYFLDPEVRTVIDIGGQDSKGIALDKKGKVLNFVMNDKCAAGTGRFLEVMARALEVDLGNFEGMSQRSTSPAKISSLCTVFAESEIISLIASGERRENIIAGLHQSIASRVASMVNRIGIKEKVMMSGGVAKNRGVAKALEEAIGFPISISPYAQELGAIGAAVLAMREKSL